MGSSSAIFSCFICFIRSFMTSWLLLPSFCCFSIIFLWRSIACTVGFAKYIPEQWIRWPLIRSWLVARSNACPRAKVFHLYCLISDFGSRKTTESLSMKSTDIPASSASRTTLVLKWVFLLYGPVRNAVYLSPFSSSPTLNELKWSNVYFCLKRLSPF